MEPIFLCGYADLPPLLIPGLVPEKDRKARTLVAQNIGEGTALLEQGSLFAVHTARWGIIEFGIRNSGFGIDFGLPL